MQVDQLFREHLHPINVVGRPTNVHSQVAAVGPTQLRKSLREPGKPDLCHGIVFVQPHQHADPRGSPPAAPAPPAATPPRPSPAMKSRRLTRSPRRRGQATSPGLETERLGGLEVDGHLHFCDLLHRQISRLFALENPAGVSTDLPIHIGKIRPIAKKIRPIANKTASRRARSARENRRHPMTTGAKYDRN